MAKKENQMTPDEQQIEHLLKTTHVPLGNNYHRRMATMPWMANKKQGQNKMKDMTFSKRPARLALAFAALSLMMIFFVVATPAGRTFAQNTLRYFQRQSETPATPAIPSETEPVVVKITEDDTEAAGWQVETPSDTAVETNITSQENGTKTVTIDNPENEPIVVDIETDAGSAAISSNEDVETTIIHDEESLTTLSTDNSENNASGGGGGGFATNNVSLDEASNLLGFEVATIENLPAGYQLVTTFAPIADMESIPAGMHVPTFITLYYENGADRILLTQDSTLAADGNVGQSVGDNAVVQIVDIAPNVMGEYVQGIWVLPDDFQPETDPMSAATWDNDAPNKSLSWEANGVRYQIQSSSSTISMADLIGWHNKSQNKLLTP